YRDSPRPHCLRASLPISVDRAGLWIVGPLDDRFCRFRGGPPPGLGQRGPRSCSYFTSGGFQAGSALCLLWCGNIQCDVNGVRGAFLFFRRHGGRLETERSERELHGSLTWLCSGVVANSRSAYPGRLDLSAKRHFPGPSEQRSICWVIPIRAEGLNARAVWHTRMYWRRCCRNRTIRWLQRLPVL